MILKIEKKDWKKPATSCFLKKESPFALFVGRFPQAMAQKIQEATFIPSKKSSQVQAFFWTLQPQNPSNETTWCIGGCAVFQEVETTLRLESDWDCHVNQWVAAENVKPTQPSNLCPLVTYNSSDEPQSEVHLTWCARFFCTRHQVLIGSDCLGDFLTTLQ